MRGAGTMNMQIPYYTETILLTSPAELHDVAPPSAHVVSTFSATYEGPA
jgi:hypothetical protein